MTYLVAKYCLLFFLTSFIGFLIGRWSIRRLFVDVTDSYETLNENSRAANEAPWDEIRARFDGITGNVRNIVQNEFRAHPYPEIPQTKLEKLDASLNSLTRLVKDTPPPPSVDLKPIQTELSHLSLQVRTLNNELPRKLASQDALDSLGEALESQLSRLADDIAAVPEAIDTPVLDFAPLERQIATLQQTVDTLPREETADLSGIYDRFDNIDLRLRAQAEDMSPTTSRLDELHRQINDLSFKLAESQQQNTLSYLGIEELNGKLISLHAATKDAAASHTDDAIGKLNDTLNAMNMTLAEIRQQYDPDATSELTDRLHNIEQSQRHGSDENNKLQRILDGIAQDLDEIHQKQEEDFTHSPTALRFDRLEEMIEETKRHQFEQLAPIDERFDDIQMRLKELNKHASNKSMTILEHVKRPSIGPQLLKRAEFGRKDKLQEIAGIGPKLEQTLNKLGIYYYWQIAAWDKRDIRTVDANLDTFRGRIERDDWVRQAKVLRKNAQSARPPSGRDLAQKLN
ncbi:MAG: hypothetical protein AAF387_07560 [Pseudomonadota bacterium]